MDPSCIDSWEGRTPISTGRRRGFYTFPKNSFGGLKEGVKEYREDMENTKSKS